MIRLPCSAQFLVNIKGLVVPQFVYRGVWTSALYADGARHMVKWLDMSMQEFRDLCDSVEEGSDIPKERYFDWSKNKHQLNNLKAFTSWGLTQEDQKSVVVSCPQIIERKTKHLEALRGWYMDKFEIPPNDFRHSFTSYPWLLSRATQYQVADVVKAFKHLGFTSIHLQVLLRDAPRTFHFPSPQQVGHNGQCYLDMSISCDQLVRMLSKEPELLGYSYVLDVRKKMRWMIRELRIDKRKVVHEILVNHPGMVLRAWMADMNNSLTWLKEKGVKKEHIQKIALEHPKVLLWTSLRDIHKELMLCKDLVEIDYL